VTAAETSVGPFVADALRLAADIDRETYQAGSDTERLRAIVRATSQAVDVVTAARRRTEEAMHKAREEVTR
jgi:hypothetical protein